MPRIINDPWPRSEQRFHHHNGDGYTEIGVLEAHSHWQSVGYKTNYFLPCFIIENITTNSCTTYTHYPPGIYLFSSFFLTVFGAQENISEFALKATRLVLYFLSLFISSFAILLIGTGLNFSFLSMITMAFVLGLTRAFWLFADNLFGHGLVLSLFGLFLGVILAEKNRWKTYGVLGFISTFLSVELIPVLFLMPLLLVIWRNSDIWKKKIFSFWMVSAVGVFLAFFIRIWQNSLYAGSLEAVFQDWASVIYFRITGSASAAGHTVVDGKEMIAGISFLKSYAFALYSHQRVMITKIGLLAFALVNIFFLYKKMFQDFAFILGFYFIALAWAFLFIQHSIIHLFVFRYVAWPLALALALGVSRCFPHAPSHNHK